MLQPVSIVLIVLVCCLAGCRSSAATETVVKPRYHRSWTNGHIHKKKYGIGRLRLRFEKQGVKKVKVKG